MMGQVKENLWEILVPVYDNNDVEWTIKHHREWDKEVRGIAGGLTINKRYLEKSEYWSSISGKGYTS